MSKMSPLHSVRSFAWFTVICEIACAQTFVVSADGSGDFRDIPNALAATGDGATLIVRPGSYSPFSITNRSVKILGTSPGGYPYVGLGTVSISGTSKDREVMIVGLEFAGGLGISQCKGAIVLQDVIIHKQSTIDSCQNVHVLDSVATAVGGNSYGYYPATLQVTDSTLEVTRSALRGADGRTDFVWSVSGCPALSVSGTTLWLTATSLGGGSGASSSSGGGAGPAGGGTALKVISSSLAHISGACVLSGGSGGNAPYWSFGAPAGSGVDCDTSSRVVAAGSIMVPGIPGQPPSPFWPPAPPFTGPVVNLPELRSPRLSSSGTFAPNGSVQWKVQAQPGALGILAVGGAPPGFTYYDFLFPGALLIAPLVFVPLVVDATGTSIFTIAVPSTHPGGVAYFAQAATFNANMTQLLPSGSLLTIGRY